MNSLVNSKSVDEAEVSCCEQIFPPFYRFKYRNNAQLFLCCVIVLLQGGRSKIIF